MDFSFTPEQEQFRKDIREFLEKELPEEALEVKEDNWIHGFSRGFSRKLAQKGWIGLTWPREYGGQGKGYLDRLILSEELLRAGAPVMAHWFGDRQVGPALLAHGNEEQRQEFIPQIVRAEIAFCLGQSEPEAGSDLASLQTRAIEDEEGFVINGQKVWTSAAQWADYGYFVFRTDPDAPKHRGISELLISMKLPGITVRPLTEITGEQYLNEVFFDNVRAPKSALIGQKNRGWYQIMSQLDYERSGIERVMSNYPLFMDIIQMAKETGMIKQPSVRRKLAELEVEFEIGRLLCYRVAWMLSEGTLPNYEAAMAKAYSCEYEKRLANAATLFLGLYGQLMPGSKRTILNGRAARNYLYCPGYTLQGGTTEILRNIVATRGLGLPTA